MGASDLNNGNIDLDMARLDRSTRTNQPDFAPGQGVDDLFSSNLGGVNAPVQPNTIDLSSAFQPPVNNPYGVPQVNQQPQEPVKSDDEKIFEAGFAIGKAFVRGLLEIVGSIKDMNVKSWAQWAATCATTGLVLTGVGLLLILFRVTGFGFNLMIGSMIAMAIGSLVVCFITEKARGYIEPTQEPETPMPESSGTVDFSSDTDFNFDSDDEDSMYDDEDEDFGLFSGVTAQPQEGMDFDTALDTIPEIDKGMYTRSYLYEAFSKVLDLITPSYNTVRSFDEDSDTFLTWEQYLRDSAEVVGGKSDDLPELLSLEETAMTIRLTCTRPRNTKYDAIAVELANIYANATGTKNPNVYAICDAVGKECHFTVFTGEKVMVSLKDMYQNCKDFVLSTKNYMPIVLGINQEGKEIYADFKKIESILVTGMPRKGKSWIVQLILTQMCALLSPKELNIYICDPKDDISDFKRFTLPHVKKFVSGDDNIVNTLRKVIKEEAPKRKKLIGKAGFVNIWDYKEAYPDVDLPIIYVLIDEVVTLAERMDKETKSEFQGYLVELISQLPALGIRAFLIPHVVKNEIIAKTATDLIPCRISVCGDAGHIEACTGTKPRDFTYKLSNVGDMAVRVPDISPLTLFVHGGVLSASNPKNNKIFDYIRRLWLKLEPDCMSEPVHILVKKKDDMKDLCESFEVKEEDMLGFDDLDIL